MSYWRTLKGLLSRAADIAHNITWKTMNYTIKEMVAVYEAPIPSGERAREEIRRELEKLIAWETMRDLKVCAICKDNRGEYDAKDPFLPDMPAHPMCRCFWEVKIRAA